jgi:hypothetical protein
LLSFWNVPFKTYIFSFDTNEIGYELYRLPRSCVKQCDSQLSFGFPSYGPIGLDTSEYYDFFDYCRENNCCDEWVRMGSVPLMTVEEINTLKGRSMPKILKTDIEVNNRRINYYSKLEPHEIRLIEIKKK